MTTALIVLVLSLALQSHAADILQTYFVAFPENDMQHSLNAIDDYGGAIGDVMHTVISIVASSSNSIFYYDHWEDGYEADITSPTQSTTLIWGDNNTTNGIPPGFTNDIVTAGDVINLETNIDVTRTSVTIEYDGKDKFSATRPVAVSRAMYAIDPGEVCAGSAQVFDVSQWGTTYRAPAGVGTGTGPGTNEVFEYTSLFIMAGYDFTLVEIDEDNDGVVDTTVRLNQGEAYQVNGGVTAGATVTASKPVQCHLVSGDIGSNYEMRWFTLWPEYQWGDEYYTPVGGRMDGVNDHNAYVYAFNPNTYAIDVHYETKSSTGSVTVAANSVSGSIAIPNDSGAHYWSTNGSKFLMVEIFDGWNNLQRYDWGLGLPPRETLTTVAILGWGPGFGSTSSGTNANPVWATAVTNTTLYIDTDGDPGTGPLVDPHGNRYDFSTNVTAFESVRLYDYSDDDQTGMRVYTVDGTHIIAAWGEDPEPAEPGNPYLDMGNIILPFPTVLATKYGTLFIDVNSNGVADPGDSIEFTIEVRNVGYATANNVILEDEGTTNQTTYVTNSTTLNGNPFLDDSPPDTPFPLDEGGGNIGRIYVGETTIVEYVTTIIDPYPTNVDPCIFNEASATESNGSWTTLGMECVNQFGLQIDKKTSTTNVLYGGETLTYTIEIWNTGAVTYTGLMLEDYLPVGVTYVSNTTWVYYPFAVTNNVYDRFNFQFYTNSNGTVSWMNNWQETGESDGPLVGDVTVSPDTGISPTESFALDVSGQNNGAWRAVDLDSYSSATLSFDYRRDGLDAATDWVEVRVSTDGWGTSATLMQLAGAATDAAYISTNFDLTSYISTNTAIGFFSSTDVGMGAADVVWFDDVKVTFSGSAVTNAGSDPVTLLSEYQLPPGTSMVVTLDVLVNDPPTATQLVNEARVRADQHEEWLYDWVTNVIDATEGVVITKATSTTNLLDPGDPITYTITILNTGDVQQTSVELEDILPPGVTYSNATAQVWRPYLHTNTFLDQFNSVSYTGHNGNVEWSDDWQEINEADGPAAGNVRVANDGGTVPGHVYALRIDNAGYGAYREMDMAGYTNAVLSFEYRRDSLEDAGDNVSVYVSSAGGGGPWTLLDTFAGPATDGNYISTNIDITAYISAQTAVRFLSAATSEAGDYVFFDDVRIDYSASNATNALSPPPDLFEGYYIPPGTLLVVTLDVTVDDPATALILTNTARMRSDQQPDWLYAWATNRVDGSFGLTVDKTSSAQGHYWGLWETNLYTITIINTGSLDQTDITVTDYLPTGTTYVAGSTWVVAPGTQTNVTTNVTSVLVTNTVRDEFNSRAWTNNDGNVDWSRDWLEEGDDGIATSGDVQVYASAPFAFIRGPNNGLNRIVDLEGSTSAVFSFDFSRYLMDDTNDYVAVYVSSNGTSAWTELDRFQGPGSDYPTFYSTNYDIVAYEATNTAIRFYSSGLFGAGDYIALDNVQVEFTVSSYSTNITTNIITGGSVTNAGGAPPDLASGYTLSSGQTMTVTFEVTLTLPTDMTAITNTAYVASDQQPQIEASVTDLVAFATVGDYVWNDLNTNGIQDVGEPGITNITVNLYDAGTNLVATTLTDTNGNYLFSGYPTNSYFVEFVLGPYFSFTLEGQGGDPSRDSDADPVTGRTAPFDLGINETNLNIDAGMYYPPSSIGDYVWLDSNSNGLQDVGEPGFTNVTVQLYSGSGSLVGSTTTDSSGNYYFTSLDPGNYFVHFVRPLGYAFTLQNQGSSDTNDSDANPATGSTATFLLPSGTNDYSWDAGLIVPQSGLYITKTSDTGGSCLDAGDTITYTITLGNTGTVEHTGVTITDPTPTGTTYVAGSVVVTAPSGLSNNVLDLFNAVAYTNNDGSTNWSGDWVENDPYGNPGPVGDYVGVTGGRLFIHYAYVDDESAQRSVDLTGYTTSSLSFDWETVGLDAGETISVLISTNSGGTFTTLATLGGTASGNTNYDITSYIADDTTVRFVDQSENWESGEYAYFDNVQMVFETTRSGTPGDPPTLASGYTLNTGETMTVTFEVTVDTPSTVTQIVNTATATTDTSEPIYASVTDCVAHVDLGVTKIADKAVAYSTNDMVWYTIVLTNNGPFDATSIELTDDWPSNVTIWSATASQGSYDFVANVWSVGDLTAGSFATLWLTGQVESLPYVYITNGITITYLDQLDINPSNDTATAVIETLVVLARFEVYEKNDQVVVEWETCSEAGTVGFYLFRRDEGKGAFKPVGDGFLPSVLLPQGGIYQLIDNEAAKGGRYQYRLVEVTADGQHNSCGMFDVIVESVLKNPKPLSPQRGAPRATGRDSAREPAAPAYVRKSRPMTKDKKQRIEKRKIEHAEAAAARRSLRGNEAKIKLSEEGVYYVDAQDVATVLDLPLWYAERLIDRYDLQLLNMGEPVTYVAGEAGEGFYFYGEAIDNIYTDENVYWLRWGRNQPPKLIWGNQPAASPWYTKFRDDVHVEEDLMATPALFKEDDADFWMWAPLIGGNPTFGVMSNAVPSAGRAAGDPATLRVRCIGGSRSGVADEHHVVISVNGTQVADATWTGLEVYEVEADIAPSMLNDPEDNVVVVTALLDAGAPYSIFYVDELDLSYDRYYRVVDDRLTAGADGNPVVTFRGFSDPNISVLDVTDPKDIALVAGVRIDQVQGKYRASLRAGSATSRYAGFGPGAVDDPDEIVAAVPTSLTAETNRANYVIITVRALKESAEALAAYRRSRGCQVMLVTDEEVYDAFGYGIAEPAAIREFLLYAHLHWQVPPEYVVLVGEGTFDHKDRMGRGDNLIGPKMIGTPYGVYESDTWYGDVVGNDGVPEMAIGRLPVMTVEELDAMIAKIIAYEAAIDPPEGSGAGWMKRVMLTADNADLGGDFPADSDEMGQLIPDPYIKSKIYLSEMTAPAARSAVIDGISNGSLLMNYIGHGGMDRFAQEGLLMSSDVGNLANAEKLPVVVGMTCITGRYGVPGYDCLSEELVLSEIGGAIGVWAPSGLSMNSLAKMLDEGFLRARFQDEQMVLGEQILSALEDYAASGNPKYMLLIYNLLGDPALRMK